jgi:hypothetical protein
MEADHAAQLVLDRPGPAGWVIVLDAGVLIGFIFDQDAHHGRAGTSDARLLRARSA